MTDERLTNDDEGKRVVSSDGTDVGRLIRVENGRGYVAPDPGLFGTIKAKLGWETVPEDAHPLDEGSIDRITEDTVYLRGTL